MPAHPPATSQQKPPAHEPPAARPVLRSSGQPEQRRITAVDLFCGAGGTSTGLRDACADAAVALNLTAINHWSQAISTHTLNHPEARHLCANLDEVVPSDLFAADTLDLMVASPECIYHSTARGGKPIPNQKRPSAWCVPRWAESCRPKVIIIENVPEFRKWGPIGSNGKPLKSRQGEAFNAWLAAIKSQGYQVVHRVLCAADYGDPTTRRRLFIVCVRGRRKYEWPEPTHASKPELRKGSLFAPLKPWVAAREIIDWTNPGKSIFARERPLKLKTLQRIEIGLRKFGLAAFILPQHRGGAPVHDPANPLATITTDGGHALASPYLIAMEQSGRNGGHARDIDRPAPTITTAKGGALAVADPYLVHLRGTGKADSVKKPIRAVAARGQHVGVGQPFFIHLRGQSKVGDLDSPAPAVTSGGGHLGLAQPWLVETAHGPNGGERVRSIEDPMATVTGNRGSMAVCEPWIVDASHGPSSPGNHRVTSVEEPLRTVAAGGVHTAVCQGFLLPHDGVHGGNAPRSLDEPLPTVTASHGAGILVQPCLIKYYGTAGAQSVEEPVGTVTTKPRFGLVQPIVEIDGERYAVDILFRMLTPTELARAQGFPDTYLFTGNKEKTVRQIGNAVPTRLAKALAAQALKII